MVGPRPVDRHGHGRNLRVELETVEVTWGTAVSALQANQIDIMFVLDATPERALAIDFPSQPLL